MKKNYSLLIFIFVVIIFLLSFTNSAKADVKSYNSSDIKVGDIVAFESGQTVEVTGIYSEDYFNSRALASGVGLMDFYTYKDNINFTRDEFKPFGYSPNHKKFYSLITDEFSNELNSGTYQFIATNSSLVLYLISESTTKYGFKIRTQTNPDYNIIDTLYGSTSVKNGLQSWYNNGSYYVGKVSGSGYADTTLLNFGVEFSTGMHSYKPISGVLINGSQYDFVPTVPGDGDGDGSNGGNGSIDIPGLNVPNMPPFPEMPGADAGITEWINWIGEVFLWVVKVVAWFVTLPFIWLYNTMVILKGYLDRMFEILINVGSQIKSTLSFIPTPILDICEGIISLGLLFSSVGFVIKLVKR